MQSEAPTEIYTYCHTLTLHYALPLSGPPAASRTAGQRNQEAARIRARSGVPARPLLEGEGPGPDHPDSRGAADGADRLAHDCHGRPGAGRDLARQRVGQGQCGGVLPRRRSAEGHHQRRAQIGRHTSELQSLMRISYAVFCLKKKKSTTIVDSNPSDATDVYT